MGGEAARGPFPFLPIFEGGRSPPLFEVEKNYTIYNCRNSEEKKQWRLKKGCQFLWKENLVPHLKLHHGVAIVIWRHNIATITRLFVIGLIQL
jgi:hypothetical protein